MVVDEGRRREGGDALSRTGVLRCLLAAVLFGASAPAASRLADDMGFLALAGLLYLGAALAVGPTTATKPPTLSALAQEWKPALMAVLAGGAVGPALLVAGLARTNAATASILLNLELAATVVLAWTIFREHIGRRLVLSAGLVMAGGVLLVWSPGARLDVGALLIAGACLCWGVDNGVTARIEQLAPEHVVFLKGLVAGGANLALGLVVAGGIGEVGAGEIVWALLIGAGGYGLSITLWVKGARELGAARGQVIFATAPFIGAALAWVVWAEPVEVVQLVAVVFAAAGVGISLRTDHEHPHRHEPVSHDHEHTHDDDHHDHHHADGFTGRHSHPHTHRETVHSHPHVPDLHHRHTHDD